MFANYLKVAFRNIRKYKVFSFINVFGLAASMSVCMLIILIIADQRGYDRFHSHKRTLAPGIRLQDPYYSLADPG